jgi:hypothetical protein
LYHLAFDTDLTQLFAFSYNALIATEVLYDAKREFARMGVFVGQQQNDGISRAWCLTEANAQYSLCASYPRVLATPQFVSDELLRCVAAFRYVPTLPSPSATTR